MIKRIGDAFIQSHPLLEGADLVQEAFRRLLEPEKEGKPKRHWRRGLDKKFPKGWRDDDKN